MNENVSKQLKYRRKARAEGRCKVCGEPKWVRTKDSLCRKHFVTKSLYDFKLPYLDRQKRKRNSLRDFVLARFERAEKGRGTPFRSWLQAADVINDVFEWRLSEWRSPEGFQFAVWLWKWDRRLRGASESAHQESIPGSLESQSQKPCLKTT